MADPCIVSGILKDAAGALLTSTKLTFQRLARLEAIDGETVVVPVFGPEAAATTPVTTDATTAAFSVTLLPGVARCSYQGPTGIESIDFPVPLAATADFAVQIAQATNIIESTVVQEVYAARDLSQAYAQTPEDTTVPGGTGYSSAHYAAKAEAAKADAETLVGQVGELATVQATADQIAADRGLAETAAANAQAAARTCGTWTALLALTGTVDGEGAEVLDADTGTHLAASGTGYDGASVNNAGRYSWNATWSRWVRIGDTGLAGKAGLSDIDALAAYPEGAPAYTNAGGQGDRTASVTVTVSSTALTTNTPSNLVDGATANNSTDSIAFAAVSVTDKWILYDFGYGQERIITEVTWKQSNASTHGTWKWQGTKDGTTFTDIGSSFTLGGSTAQVQTALSANVIGYRAYRVIGVSGTASAAPWIQEVEFKITGAPTQGYTTRDEISPFPPEFPTAKLVSAYFFDEADETSVRDVWRGRHIDLTTPTTPGVTLTGRSVKLASGLIETPTLYGVQSQTILYRCNRGGTTGFLISGGGGSGTGVLQQSYSVTEGVWLAGAGLGWFAPQGNSGGGAAYALNRGGWMALHREDTTTRNSIYGLGGRHSTTTSRCAEFEIGCAFFWSSTLTSDERDAVLLYIRQRAARRSIWIHRADAPETADLYALFGESNADGRALIANLSATDQAADYRHTLISALETTTSKAAWDKLELGYNQKYSGSGFSIATYIGPEIGIATQRRAGYLASNRRAAILKNAKGGTRIAPTSTGITAANSWNASEAADSGSIFWKVLYMLQEQLQDLLAKGIGFGDTVRVGMLIGLNDATSTTYTTDAATYQGYLQDWLDTLQYYLPGLTLIVTIFRPHLSDPASDPTAIGHVRTAVDAFATANANVTSVDTDAYGKIVGDEAHYDAAACKTIGVSIHG